MQLNQRALRLCEQFVAQADELRVAVRCCESGARIVDCGVFAPGGLEAGRLLAEICLSGLGRVQLLPAATSVGMAVSITTDHPVAACMASQYAGWQLAGEKFFAMGSGPMRAAAGKEKLFEDIGLLEKSSHVVGVLETRKLPPAEVCQHVADACGAPAEKVTLLIAPTASQAGTLQVVARSVETSLHKLHSLGFDLAKVRAGHGVAPLPPVAKDDITAIGWTNDAILYGGQVSLWIDADDAALRDIGPRIPSSASKDFGQPFAVLYERSGRDFYKLDPHLFSPAMVSLISLQTGNVHRFGDLVPEVLASSWDRLVEG